MDAEPAVKARPRAREESVLILLISLIPLQGAQEYQGYQGNHQGRVIPLPQLRDSFFRVEYIHQGGDMTALKLALRAKHLGARFAYHDGEIIAIGLDRLPTAFHAELRERLGDVLAVVAEHSPPHGLQPSDLVDAARRVALAARKAVQSAT